MGLSASLVLSTFPKPISVLDRTTTPFFPLTEVTKLVSSNKAPKSSGKVELSSLVKVTIPVTESKTPLAIDLESSSR